MASLLASSGEKKKKKSSGWCDQPAAAAADDDDDDDARPAAIYNGSTLETSVRRCFCWCKITSFSSFPPPSLPLRFTYIVSRNDNKNGKDEGKEEEANVSRRVDFQSVSYRTIKKAV